jgi:hypothetical protein
MGFHKRYIDDDQVISIYDEQGSQAVINLYTSGVDALIISGELSEQVEEIIYSRELTKLEKYHEVQMIVSMASIRKINYEKKTTATSS